MTHWPEVINRNPQAGFPIAISIRRLQVFVEFRLQWFSKLNSIKAAIPGQESCSSFVCDPLRAGPPGSSDNSVPECWWFRPRQFDSDVRPPQTKARDFLPAVNATQSFVAVECA